MGKFYTKVTTTKTASSSNNSSSSSSGSSADLTKINIELNGDVLGYGTPEEILTVLAPSGVKEGSYSKVRVNTKGLVVEGLSDDNVTVAIKTYKFPTSALRWIVNHNLATRDFVASVRNNDGDIIYTNIKIVDENSFWVDFTEATSGKLSVTFDLSNTVIDTSVITL